MFFVLVCCYSGCETRCSRYFAGERAHHPAVQARGPIARFGLPRCRCSTRSQLPQRSVRCEGHRGGSPMCDSGIFVYVLYLSSAASGMLELTSQAGASLIAFRFLSSPICGKHTTGGRVEGIVVTVTVLCLVLFCLDVVRPLVGMTRFECSYCRGMSCKQCSSCCLPRPDGLWR